MRRWPFRLAFILTSLALIATLTAPSAAGGGNWLEFRRASQSARSDPAIFALGERVVAYANVYAQGPFQRRILGRGPFVAWLRPERPRYGGPGVPVAPVALGTFDLRRLSAHVFRASAHFTVPAVPSGAYTVTICNEPCVHRGLGEGVQGWIQVVDTPVRARLLALARERRWHIRELEGTVARIRERRDSLESDLARGQTEMNVLGLELERADRRAARLRNRVNAAVLEPTRGRNDGAIAAVACLALLALFAAAVLLRRRRWTARVRIPDTAAELTEGAELVRR
jgi:hypothetical protein